MFGKIIAGIISSKSLLGAELAEILVFAGCLFLNNYLYKTLAFNLSLRNAVSKAVGFGAAVWKTAKIAAAVAGA